MTPITFKLSIFLVRGHNTCLAPFRLSRAKTEAIVLDLFTNLSKALRKGQKVTLSPFGTFVVKKRAARKGRNPATGATVKIKAKKVVGFKPYAGLKGTIG